jgi:hypothetical protein
MIRRLALAALLLLAAPPARADQYDAVLKYATRADALADPNVQQHMDALRTLFAGDRVIPDIKVWRASQDNPDGTHNYLAGYFVLISLPRLVVALRDDTAVQVVIDRDLANQGLPGAIVRSTVGAVVLQDIRFEPVFAGSSYPWGQWQ